MNNSDGNVRALGNDYVLSVGPIVFVPKAYVGTTAGLTLNVSNVRNRATGLGETPCAMRLILLYILDIAYLPDINTQTRFIIDTGSALQNPITNNLPNG